MSSSNEKAATEEQPADEIILGTRGGENVLVASKEGEASRGSEQAGGRLYTDDMPAIEDLLARYEIVTAVLHKPIPFVEQKRTGGEYERQGEHPAKSSEKEQVNQRPLPFVPVLVLGGLPAATFIAGLVMLAGALMGGAIVSNAYIGLLLLFGGLGLGVVAKIALSEEANP